MTTQTFYKTSSSAEAENLEIKKKTTKTLRGKKNRFQFNSIYETGSAQLTPFLLKKATLPSKTKCYRRKKILGKKTP